MWAFQTFLVVIVTAGSTVTALPAASDTTTSQMLKRTINGAAGANCNGYTFIASQVSDAAQASADHVANGTAVGSNKYPHAFDNREGFTWPSGCTAPRYEYPLFKNYTYTGGDPSVDRVIIGGISGSNAYSCGVVTHKGASGNNFLKCEDT